MGYRVSTYGSFDSGLSDRQWRRNITPMPSFTQLLPAPVLPAIFLICLAVAAHADPVDCELNKVALARVVTKNARLNFIAGRCERRPAWTTDERQCTLNASLVPADE